MRNGSQKPAGCRDGSKTLPMCRLHAYTCSGCDAHGYVPSWRVDIPAERRDRKSDSRLSSRSLTLNISRFIGLCIHTTEEDDFTSVSLARANAEAATPADAAWLDRPSPAPQLLAFHRVRRQPVQQNMDTGGPCRTPRSVVPPLCTSSKLQFPPCP